MVLEIPLTRGMVALIDDEYFSVVIGHRWFASEVHPGKFYAAYRINRKDSKKSVYMHRLIAGAVDGQSVDHRDGNGLNNRGGNLRICTAGQNQANSGKKTSWKSPPTSRYKGVCWLPKERRWAAQITCNRRHTLIGWYVDEQEAARAYDSIAKAKWGEFAQLNF